MLPRLVASHNENRQLAMSRDEADLILHDAGGVRRRHIRSNRKVEGGGCTCGIQWPANGQMETVSLCLQQACASLVSMIVFLVLLPKYAQGHQDKNAEDCTSKDPHLIQSGLQ